MKKQFLKSKPVCKVTFKIPADAAGDAKVAHVVGEFNDWSIVATPMKRLKSGGFSVVVDLEKDRDYQFRYLLDGSRWENDWEADRYEACVFGNCENSVVST